MLNSRTTDVQRNRMLQKPGQNPIPINVDESSECSRGSPAQCNHETDINSSVCVCVCVFCVREIDSDFHPEYTEECAVGRKSDPSA